MVATVTTGTQGGEVDGHAFGEFRHVGLGDIGAHGHGIEVCQAQHRRCRLGGIDGLALTHCNAHDRAVDRGGDLGIAEVGFLHAHVGLLLCDLRLGLDDLVPGVLQRGLGVDQLLVGGGIFRVQVLLALIVALGLREVVLLRFKAGLGGPQAGAVGLDAQAGIGGIDGRQPVADLHHIAHLDEELLDLARHLRTDIHVIARFERAGGGHEVFDVAHRHGAEEIFALVLAGAEVGPGAIARQGHHGRRNGDLAATGAATAAGGSRRFVHVLVRQVWVKTGRPRGRYRMECRMTGE